MLLNFTALSGKKTVQRRSTDLASSKSLTFPLSPHMAVLVDLLSPQVMVFEEQEADGKIQFASGPDYGMTVDVQWGLEVRGGFDRWLVRGVPRRMWKGQAPVAYHLILCDTAINLLLPNWIVPCWGKTKPTPNIFFCEALFKFVEVVFKIYKWSKANE